MSSIRRTNRVAALVQTELARLLLQEVSDPTLKDIVVTEVDLSPDLKHAKVFFNRYEVGEMVLPKIKEVQKGFGRATPFLRKKLGINLELRSIPELTFVEDTHNRDVNHLLGVMDTISQKPVTATQG